MTHRNDDDELPWPPPQQRPRRPPPPTPERRGHDSALPADAGMAPTQRAELASPATRIVRDREDYLGQGLRDIGRRIADDQVELFVSGDATAALQQQFDRLAPEPIVLHDVGTSASLRLLAALAGAAGAPLQRLTLRRQGQGVPLAVLQFVEVPLADAAAGNQVRVYSTDINADGAMRKSLATLLLGRSKLAVLMLGELPPHALTAALAPLRDAMGRPDWVSTDMLLLPLGNASALAALAAQLVGSAGVAVRVTPQAARPQDAWAFVSGAWNRLQGTGAAAAALNTDIAQAVPKPALPPNEAPTEVMQLGQVGNTFHAVNTGNTGSTGHTSHPGHTGQMGPMVHAIGGIPPAPVIKPSPRWNEYARACAAIKGVLSVCVFDLRNQMPLAHAGSETPAPDRLAIQGGLLIDGMSDAARQLGLAVVPPEATVSFGQQHLLLRPVLGHAGIVAHLLLHASGNNLLLARMQLERVPAPAAD